MKTLIITVSGRVQGVWFRASAKRIADELQIKGFVSNEPDGSVYIQAQGPDKDLKKFTDWCIEGPLMAVVESVDIQETDADPFTEFTIKRQ